MVGFCCFRDELRSRVDFGTFGGEAYMEMSLFAFSSNIGALVDGALAGVLVGFTEFIVKLSWF